jgi:GNAT superfamily N-acetyltransferase
MNALHAEAFATRLYTKDEWNWEDLLPRHSLGWVVAREGTRLVGFVNVVWDGRTHAWVQDTMVTRDQRERGIGTHMMLLVATECQKVGCQWLHVDFDEGLDEFYFRSCGFSSAAAGLMRLA